MQACRQGVGPLPEFAIGQAIQFGEVLVMEKQDGILVREALQVALQDPPGGDVRVDQVLRQMAGP